MNWLKNYASTNMWILLVNTVLNSFSEANESTIEVNGREITARNYLICTGACPAQPNIPELKDTDYLVNTTALELKDLPKRLAVIGSGYIAISLARCSIILVTLMQRSARVLKSYDSEISEAITPALTD